MTRSTVPVETLDRVCRMSDRWQRRAIAAGWRPTPPAARDLMDASTACADEISDVSDSPTATRVYVDETRGHIVIEGDDDRLVALADLGTVLHLWSSQGTILTPALARQVADALTWWADLRGGAR